MTIIYADEIGIVSEIVDEYGLDFCDGYVYFNDKKVSVNDVRRIESESNN